MTRKEANRVVSAVNAGFSAELKRAFEGQFVGVEIETGFNVIDFGMFSRRSDEQPFTPEQAAFIATFESGYMAAFMIARQEVEK